MPSLAAAAQEAPPFRLKPVCAVLCLLIGAPSASAQSATTPYRTLRHDEDSAALADRAQRTDSLDPLKYVPLSDTPLPRAASGEQSGA